MTIDPHAIPPLRPECRLTIAIPARNEAAELPLALAALARQRELSTGRLDPRTFEIVVFCNGCTDDTAGVARRFAARHADLSIIVLEATAAQTLNVGDARAAALDAAALRFLAAGRPLGVVASTDADTVVDDRWIAWTLREIAGADAVGGYVALCDEARNRMHAPQRLLYDRELAYRRLLGAIEHRYDPQPHDPEPRHDSFVGAGFAVTAQAYRMAGGVPRLACLEDVAFARALANIDARVRHSFRVRATTSARESARVAAGFGSFLSDLARKGERRERHFVQAAAATIEGAQARRELRALIAGDASPERVSRIATLIGSSPGAVRETASAATTAGALWHALEPSAKQTFYPAEPVEDAIATFRNVLQPNARKHGAGSEDEETA